MMFMVRGFHNSLMFLKGILHDDVRFRSSVLES